MSRIHCVRWRRIGSQDGQALVFVAASMVMLFAMAAFAIDTGRILQTRRQLQASTDAAALVGALELPDTAAARAAANSYSGIAGGKNARAGHDPVTMQSGYPQTKCLATTGVHCDPHNAIVVKTQATVPTFFGRAIGVTAITVTATATAGMKGGVPRPMDIAIVLDTTASMNTPCTAAVAGVANPTRLECALAGVRALLTALWPCSPSLLTCGPASGGRVAKPVDEVALMAFPGLKGSTPLSHEWDCSNNITSAGIAPYGDSPSFSLVGLSGDFRASTTALLNGASSVLVKAVDWGSGNTCSSSAYGLESPGGVGTYFADAIGQAQVLLESTGRADAQDAIILLSDGDANYAGVANPCRAAVTAAQAAATSRTWVYSIAYGALGSGTCTLDSPAISAYTTMQRIASDSSKFFNQPDPDDLTEIFRRIVMDMTTTRLLRDDVR
jgi:Flp pilus assembly protein TadG